MKEGESSVAEVAAARGAAALALRAAGAVPSVLARRAR